MTQKTPISQGSLLSSWEREMKLLRLDCRQRILISIKAVCATSTNQLYTISLKSHKNPALVFLRRLHGLLVAPYVQHKTTLRLKGGSLELEDFPQGVVTRSDSANVKVFTVDYCQ